MAKHGTHTLFLAFDPVKRQGESGALFQLYLVNATPARVTCKIKQDWGGGELLFTEQIDPQLSEPLNQITLEDLNKGPQFTLSCQFESPYNRSSNQTISIKPKNLFKKQHHLPVLNKEVYFIDVFANNPLTVRKEQGTTNSKESAKKRYASYESSISLEETDLRELKEKLLSRQQQSAYQRPEAPPDVVDLHIEQLGGDPTNMSNAEILQMQLDHFKKLLENAIACNYDKITFIHGKGKGKLKREIFAILEQYEEVRSFSNHFDARFGYGATEVLLK